MVVINIRCKKDPSLRNENVLRSCREGGQIILKSLYTIPYGWVKLNKNAIEFRVFLKKDGLLVFLPICNVLKSCQNVRITSAYHWC